MPVAAALGFILPYCSLGFNYPTIIAVLSIVLLHMYGISLYHDELLHWHKSNLNYLFAYLK